MSQQFTVSFQGLLCIWLYEKNSTCISLYLANDTSNYNNGRLIGTRMRSIQWCHFKWPWVTFDLQCHDILQRQITWRWYETNSYTYNIYRLTGRPPPFNKNRSLKVPQWLPFNVTFLRPYNRIAVVSYFTACTEELVLRFAALYL